MNKTVSTQMSGLTSRYATAEHDRVSEISVQRHSRREHNGIICPQAHDERRDAERNARGEEHSVHGHTGFRKDLWIHDHDIGHGYESGQPREEFAAHGGMVFFQMKYALKREHSFPLLLICCAPRAGVYIR